MARRLKLDRMRRATPAVLHWVGLEKPPAGRRMKINYWKVATIVLVGILSWLAYSGRSVAAQYGLNGQNYNITRTTSTSGTINVPGAIVGFSCASEVQGDVSKGDGQITSDVTCYVLSK